MTGTPPGRPHHHLSGAMESWLLASV